MLKWTKMMKMPSILSWRNPWPCGMILVTGRKSSSKSDFWLFLPKSSYGNGTIGVTWEQSDVHVPFNVYSMGKTVLTGANFSRDLDAKFAQNSKDANAKSTGLTWQYFAASDGYTRFYPALEWKRFDSINRNQLSKFLWVFLLHKLPTTLLFCLCVMTSSKNIVNIKMKILSSQCYIQRTVSP